MTFLRSRSAVVLIAVAGGIILGLGIAGGNVLGIICSAIVLASVPFTWRSRSRTG
jgi:hypothetical protein